jgi:Ca-activated chloride channel family protein
MGSDRRRRFSPGFSLALCCALVALGVLAGAAQEPSFRLGTETVGIFATVTSADHRLVPDLTRDAFSVRDNGKPQPLTIFANDVQPITMIMLLDRSGSMRANFSLVEEAAEAFVDAMLPADKARIGSFSNRIQIDPRTFTSDHEALITILRTELQPEGPTPLWNAVNVGITGLLHEQGRRVILVFTDGADSPENFRNNNSTLGDVLKRAEEEDVMVYAVGLAGQTGSGGGSYGPRPGGWGRGRGSGGGWSVARTSEKPDAGLAKLAAATGGGYFELTSAQDVRATFARVADELHHQYVLGFAPERFDDKLHTVDVRVSGSGLSVRARRSYLARRDP